MEGGDASPFDSQWQDFGNLKRLEGLSVAGSDKQKEGYERDLRFYRQGKRIR
jgi:hypothetical protein